MLQSSQRSPGAVLARHPPLNRSLDGPAPCATAHTMRRRSRHLALFPPGPAWRGCPRRARLRPAITASSRGFRLHSRHRDPMHDRWKAMGLEKDAAHDRPVHSLGDVVGGPHAREAPVLLALSRCVVLRTDLEVAERAAHALHRARLGCLWISKKLLPGEAVVVRVRGADHLPQVHGTLGGHRNLVVGRLQEAAVEMFEALTRERRVGGVEEVLQLLRERVLACHVCLRSGW